MEAWEGGLRATGGAIVLEKTFWYLVDFEWIARKWHYKAVKDTSYEVFVKDITGQHKLLRCIEPHQAETTLGVHLAPDGNTELQSKRLLKLANKWADNMRTGVIKRDEA